MTCSKREQRFYVVLFDKNTPEHFIQYLPDSLSILLRLLREKGLAILVSLHEQIAARVCFLYWEQESIWVVWMFEVFLQCLRQQIEKGLDACHGFVSFTYMQAIRNYGFCLLRFRWCIQKVINRLTGLISMAPTSSASGFTGGKFNLRRLRN